MSFSARVRGEKPRSPPNREASLFKNRAAWARVGVGLRGRADR